MKTLALALGGLAAAWMATPAIAMATQGTADQRTRAAWRARAAEAAEAAEAAGATATPSPVVVIPTQRGTDAGTRVPA